MSAVRWRQRPYRRSLKRRRRELLRLVRLRSRRSATRASITAIFPGPVDGRPVVAALWHPPAAVRQADGTVASQFLWAALDCPAIWGHIVHGGAGLDDRAVTGRLALNQREPIRGDTNHIVVGWPIARDGRKVIAGAAIFSEAGDLLVESRQTMILTDRGVPLHPDAWSAVK